MPFSIFTNFDKHYSTFQSIVDCHRWERQGVRPYDVLVIFKRTLPDKSTRLREHNTIIDRARKKGMLPHRAADVLDDLLAAAGVSWHVGVVGTDMADEEAGWLLGQPWVFTSSSGDLVAHLQSVLVTVEAGVAPEAGLAAAITALELSEPGGPNEGFRREDASLHLVFVSDADDASDAVVSGDPVQAMLDRLTIEAVNDLPALASAVVGDTPLGCTSGLGNALPGLRYVEVAEATEGKVVSICASDFAPIIEDLGNASVVLDSRFVLQQTPVSDVVTVSVDGERVTGWTLEPAVPSVRFDVPPVAGSVVVITYLVAIGV